MRRLSLAIMTSLPRTTAPIMVPGGSLISSIERPTTLDVVSSPCATASMASATPRRSEETPTISALRTWLSSAEMVACCGEIAISITLPCTRSTYALRWINTITFLAPIRLASIADMIFASSSLVTAMNRST